MEQENVHVVKSIFDAFGRGDVEGMLEFVDESVVWAIPGPESVPHYGERRGHDGVKKFLADLASALDFEGFEPQEFIPGGDKVVVIGRETVRAKPTGRRVENPWVMVFTVRRGKVTNFVCYENTAAVAEALRA